MHLLFVINQLMKNCRNLCFLPEEAQNWSRLTVMGVNGLEIVISIGSTFRRRLLSDDLMVVGRMKIKRNV